MDASNTPIKASIGRNATTDTRLRGRWLWAARAVWLVVVGVALILFAVALPARFEVLRTVCVSADCQPTQLGPGGERALIAIGLSPYDYGVALLIYDIIIGGIFAVVGLVIFWRRSDDWMAWLVSLALVAFGTTVAGPTIAFIKAYPEWRWLAESMRSFGYGSFMAMFLLFPSGRFVPRWTWIVAVAVAVWTLIAPFAISYVSLSWFLVLLGWTGFGLLAQIYRYVRVSGPTERQQTKWVVYGFSGAVLGTLAFVVPTALLPSVFSPLEAPLANLADIAHRFVAPLPIFFIPISFAIAILRYRLWDIDFLISRSLVYGGLTVLLIGLFVAILLAVSQLFQGFAGGPLVAVAVSAAVFGAIFQPSRRWLRTLVDRRLYKINIDYQKSPPSPNLPASGMTRTQLGAYGNLEPIGRGGMAEIYKARHPTLDKTVAIKVLPPALAKESDFRRRFEREAKVVAGLRHPNIVQVFDFGESESTFYMVMEYIAGRDLSDVISESSPLPPLRVKSIVQDIAAALDYAHGQGLVHRDVKPSNVMLEQVTATGQPDKGERAVLMDFGIARILTGGTRLTATGTVGTFDYIAPEQIQAASEVDGRADVYSLGVMIYQMLTGRLPFEAAHPAALLIAHLNQPCPDPRDHVRDLPERAAAAILQAMSKKPDERFNTAGEFVAAMV